MSNNNNVNKFKSLFEKNKNNTVITNSKNPETLKMESLLSNEDKEKRLSKILKTSKMLLLLVFGNGRQISGKNQHKEAVYGYEINNKMYNALEQKLYNT